MSRSYSSGPADDARLDEIVALYVAGVASTTQQKELEKKLSQDPSLQDVVSAARQAMQTAGATLEGYEPPPLDFKGGRIKLRKPAPSTSPAPQSTEQAGGAIWRVLPPPEMDMKNVAGCRAELVRADGDAKASQAAKQPESGSHSTTPPSLRRLASLCRSEPPASAPAELHEIQRSETVQDTLDLLLPLAQRAGLTGLRYLPYMEEQDGTGRLFQFAVAGHCEGDESAQWATHLSRFTGTSSLHNSAAFWPFFLSAPAIVAVDEDAAMPVECFWQEGRIPVLRVAPSATAEMAAKAWVEFPQLIRGKPVGKICCELDRPVNVQGQGLVHADLSDRLATFFSQLDSVTPLLRWLLEHELAETDGSGPEATPFAAATEMLRGAVEQCTTVRELNRVCIGGLSRLLHASSAAMFSYEADPAPGAGGLLILRSASDEAVGEQENLAAFKTKPPASSGTHTSPLAWVVQTGRSVCVNGVDQMDRREETLMQYTPDMRWEAGNPLAEVLRSSVKNVLIASLPETSAKGSGGVFCFAHTGSSDRPRGFSAAQQYWLEGVVRDLIAPRYERLFQERRAQNTLRISTGINALSVRDSATVMGQQATLQQLRELALKTMPVLPESRQAFYISLADVDGVSFRAHLIDDKLGAELDDAKIPLAGSLTQQAMQQEGVIYLNDLPSAAAEGRYAANVPHACVALACGIRFGQRSYGALVLESDRFSLNPSLHGGALQTLASFAAESFAAKDLAEVCAGQATVKQLLSEVEKFAASGNDEECIVETSVSPSLTYPASEELLQIVWRLLRCAWQHSRQVAIQAASADGCLELRLSWQNTTKAAVEVSEQEQRLAGFYIATARQIAASISSDAQPSCIEALEDSFVVRLPLD